MKLVPEQSTAVRHFLNLVLFVVLAVSLPKIFEYIIYQSTPFTFNVHHTHREYHDVCYGDRFVSLDLKRGVRPADGVDAKAVTELVRFEPMRTVETDWKETRAYTYQQANSTVTVEVLLPENLKPGTYGFIEHVTIYPYWGIEKSRTFLAEDATFDVINCEQ